MGAKNSFSTNGASYNRISMGKKKMILDPYSNHKQKLAQKGPHETIV